jgi:hypothetical protein
VTLYCSGVYSFAVGDNFFKFDCVGILSVKLLVNMVRFLFLGLKSECARRVVCMLRFLEVKGAVKLDVFL